MSVFRCGKCENIFDGDYEGCFENPSDDCSSLCESCSMDNGCDESYSLYGLSHEDTKHCEECEYVFECGEVMDIDGISICEECCKKLKIAI